MPISSGKKLSNIQAIDASITTELIGEFQQI